MDFSDLHDQFWLNINDRRNIWHFYYFAVKNIHGFLQNFTAVANIPDSTEFNPVKIQAPTEYFCRKDIHQINLSLMRLIECFENNSCFSSEDAKMLTSNLHLLMDVLPYLNDRHYCLSRYDYENYPGEMWCSFDDLRNLDRTLAKRIAPILLDFSQCSQFPPGYFSRMYSYPKVSINKKEYEPCAEWHKALNIMSEAWDWLAARNVVGSDKWESVPDKIYYGLHLFAEYLPEMQND